MCIQSNHPCTSQKNIIYHTYYKCIYLLFKGNKIQFKYSIRNKTMIIQNLSTVLSFKNVI